MSGLTAIVNTNGVKSGEQALLNPLNPLGNFATKIWQSPSCFLATSYPAEAPSGHKRFYQDDNFVGMFAGDVVNAELLDWRDIGRNLGDDAKLPAVLRALKGSFVLVIHDLNKQVLWVATDAFGFQALYFHVKENALSISTSLGSILQASDSCNKWADSWIYQYLFFNYPVGEESLVENVQRVPAGTLGKFDVKTGRLSWTQYVEHVSSSQKIFTGQSAIEQAYTAFDSTVPGWFDTDGRVVFGLSGGLDSRAVLASLPKSILSRIETFTYGIPGSTEVTEACYIASELGLQHNEILLDDEFIQQLPRLMLDTVFLSDAQQVVNRSNLVYVYGALGEGGKPCSAIVTGVSGDHLFRDHISGWGNVPYLISADMASMFRNGRKRIDRKFYAGMFGARLEHFEAQIEDSLDTLTESYGEFTDPEAYYRYLMYVAGPNYFGGQAAIANSYSTFRTPYWDRVLIQLGMDVDLGTVGFSRGLSKKDKYREAALQASVVARNPSFSNIPYLNLPIDVFARGDQLRFQLHRVSRKIKSIVFNKKRILEENWPL
ncbi:MAG: hypothetical protein DRR42_26445, partial [Gammaproteobacteria bacterium]